METTAQHTLLPYLSNIYNKSLPVYELITSRRYDRELALLSISELYTLGATAKLFYQLTPEAASSKAARFFVLFDSFYARLKPIYLKEELDSARLYADLGAMKEVFEDLKNQLDSL